MDSHFERARVVCQTGGPALLQRAIDTWCVGCPDLPLSSCVDCWNIPLCFSSRACASVGASAFETRKQLQSLLQYHRLECDLVLSCDLVHMYSKCGSVTEARGVFETLVRRMFWLGQS